MTDKVVTSTVSISVDMKRHRIRIHKNTLSMLGTPKYVHLLVNPSNMLIAIRGTDTKTRDGHRVNLSLIAPDNSYELYSKPFIEQLCTLLPGIDTEGIYKLIGKGMALENAAIFSLNTIQKDESWEVNDAVTRTKDR